jgi:hypothetical protein
MSVSTALAGGRELNADSQDYRQKQKHSREPLRSAAGFDATPATPTGVRLDRQHHDIGCASRMLPLYHRLPD